MVEAFFLTGQKSPFHNNLWVVTTIFVVRVLHSIDFRFLKGIIQMTSGGTLKWWKGTSNVLRWLTWPLQGCILCMVHKLTPWKSGELRGPLRRLRVLEGVLVVHGGPYCYHDNPLKRSIFCLLCIASQSGRGVIWAFMNDKSADKQRAILGLL